MKNFALWLGALLISASCLQAQVTVEVTLDQEQFLPGEALPATVRITNRSGQTLDLGAEESWLTFAIESKEEGFVAVKKGEAPVAGEFTLESSKRAIKQVDLAPYFSFSQAGRYSIVATVTIKAWNRQISSQPKSFDIIEGSKLWEQEVGLPQPSNAADSAPELRRYTLHQANYLQKRLTLYVQITDSSGKVYKVFPIGPMLSFGQPEPQVDRLSNLHVLYQDGPHSFNYTVVNPDGVVLVRQTYDYTTRPRLKVDSERNLKVVGGTRHLMPSDVPPPKIAEEKIQPPEP
jgi:hypothetical protein